MILVYYKNLRRSTITKKIDNHFEKSVLQNAKQVVFVNKSTEEEYQRKYNFLKGKSNVLYWGYDEEVFGSLPPNPLPKEGGFKNNKPEKVIVHAGNLFLYQNPKNFWNQIKIENDQGNKFRIKFIGSVDKEILDYFIEIGLRDQVELAGFLPYPEMIKQILEADLLLVCSSEPRHVPGKLFEALRTGNPIIVFGDNNEEVKNILNDSNAGMMFGYEESGKEFLENINKAKPDQVFVKRFDRAEISKDFYSILKKSF